MSRRGSILEVAMVSLVLAGCTAVVGCDGCGGDADGPAPSVAEVELGPLPEEVPLPGAVYQSAYDRALEEIDADNAHDRLREIERTIARERRALP